MNNNKVAIVTGGSGESGAPWLCGSGATILPLSSTCRQSDRTRAVITQCSNHSILRNASRYEPIRSGGYDEENRQNYTRGNRRRRHWHFSTRGRFIPGFKRCCTNWRFYEHKTYDCFCPRALGGRFFLEQGNQSAGG